MKKIIALALASLMLLSFAACSSGGASSSTSTPSDAPSSSAPADPSSQEPVSSSSATPATSESATEQEGKGTIGDYEVEIVSCELTKDYNDKDVALITYNFTNNSDKAAKFMVSVSEKAFQDGVELSTAIVLDDKVDAQALMKEVQPGASLTFTRAYKVESTDTEINVECSKYTDLNGKGPKVVKSFSLSE